MINRNSGSGLFRQGMIMNSSIEKLIIKRDSITDPITDNIIGLLPQADIITVDDIPFDRTYNNTNTLFLKRYRGRFIKDFPTPAGSPPAQEKYIITMLNCPFRCKYCYLQVYLQHRRITLFTNRERLRNEIAAVISEDSPARMTTGEMGDSLALDHITSTTSELLPLFTGTGTLYEARTKSSNVNHLLSDIPPEQFENLLITWTMAPEDAVRRLEPGSAALEERMEAIRTVSRAGIRVGIRLDPVIPFFYSRDAYRKLINDVKEVSGGSIYRFEIGIMRFPPGLWQHVRMNFPASLLMRGEFIRAPDGKIKYYRPHRLRIYREIYETVKSRFPRSPVELSMEPVGVWKDAGIPLPD